MGNVSEKSAFASHGPIELTVDALQWIGSDRRRWIDRKLVTGDAFENSVFALYSAVN
jgi:hypothetical protein